MNFRELLECNLENPEDLARLKKHKFTTNKVLDLIEELTCHRDPAIDRKKDYLEILRNSIAHSKMTVDKYAKHFQAAIKNKNFDRLLNSFVFVFSNIDPKDATQTAGIKRFADELKKDQSHAFLRLIAAGYEDDGKTYPSLKPTRKRYIQKKVVKFLKDNEAFPAQEEERQIILGAPNLKEGVHVMQFFADSHAPVSYEEGISEEVFKELLQSFALHENCDLSFLLREKSTAEIVKKLLKELVLSPENTGLKARNILVFLNENRKEFAFDDAELKDFLEQIKLAKQGEPDIYGLAICLMVKDSISEISQEGKSWEQLAAERKARFDSLVPKLDFKNLTSVEKSFREGQSGLDALRQVVAGLSLAVENTAIIEFILNNNGHEYINLQCRQLLQGRALSASDLKFAAEKLIAAGSVTALSTFFNYAAPDIDELEKEEFVDDVFRKMIEVNLNNPNSEEGKPFFFHKDFFLVLRGAKVSADLNLALRARASIIRKARFFYDEGNDLLLHSQKRSAKAPITEETLHEIFDSIAVGNRSLGREVVSDLNSLVNTPFLASGSQQVVPLNLDLIKSLYLESFVKLLVENSANPEFDVHQAVHPEDIGLFDIKTVFEVAMQVKAGSANSDRGFALALAAFTWGPRPIILRSRAELSLIIELIAAVDVCSKESAKKSAIILLAAASIENDCGPEFDEQVLEMMRNLAKINFEDAEFRNFHQLFFRKCFPLPEDQKRIIAKMNMGQRLIFVDPSELKIEEENILEILLACGRNNSAQAFRVACLNFAEFAQVHLEQKFTSAADQNSLFELLKIIIAKEVKFSVEEIERIFKAFAPDFSGFSEVENFDEIAASMKELVSQPHRFIEIFNLLHGYNKNLNLTPLFADKNIEDIAQIFVQSLQILIYGGLRLEARQSLVTQLMPKMLAQGNFTALVSLDKALSSNGDSKDQLFVEIANHMKIGRQEEYLLRTVIEEMGLSKAAKVMFVLRAYKSDSAISSTPLNPPIFIGTGAGIEINKLEQVEALFQFFPEIIHPHIATIAENDNLVNALNLTIRFYGTKYFSLEQFNFLSALHHARQGKEVNVDMTQLTSYGELFAQKSQFVKREPTTIVQTSNLGAAVLALQGDRSFEKFYESLSPENRKILGLRKEVSEDEISALESWMGIQFELIKKEYDSLRQDPKLIGFKIMRQAEESVEDFNTRKATNDYKDCAELFRRRQKLVAIIDDYEAALSEEKPAFDKLRIIGEVTKVPENFASLLTSSADIEHYNAMKANDASASLHSSYWSKFLQNLPKNLRLVGLVADEKEFADSIAAQLALVRQGECYANLQTQLQHEIERREFADINCAAISMAMFQGIAPFVMENTHNYDDPNSPELQQLHLAKNSFCYNVGDEILKMLKEASDKDQQDLQEKSPREEALKQKLSKPAQGLLKSLKDIDSILSDTLEDDDPIRQFYQTQYKNFVARQGGGGASSETDSNEDSLNDFLAQQRVEMIKSLGHQACKSVFSKEFFAEFNKGFSVELELTPSGAVVSGGAGRVVSAARQGRPLMP